MAGRDGPGGVGESGPMADAKPTIVLVHGAWADGSSWTRVIQRLGEAGHDVVTLPNGLRGGAADAAVIRAYLDTIDGSRGAGRAFVRRFRHHERGQGREQRQGTRLRRCLHPGRRPERWRSSRARSRWLTAALTDPTKVFKLVPIPGAPADRARHLPAAGGRGRQLRQRRVGGGGPSSSTRPSGPPRWPGLLEPSGPPAWKDIPAVGRDRHAGPDHPAKRATSDGEDRGRTHHRGRRLTRVDGVAPADRGRGDRAGAG